MKYYEYTIDVITIENRIIKVVGTCEQEALEHAKEIYFLEPCELKILSKEETGFLA